MRCQNCHELVPDTAKVCGNCGIKLDKSAMFPCPSCGEDVPVTAKVCGNCGTRLAEAAAVKTAPPMEEVKVEKPRKAEATAKVAMKTAPVKKAEPAKERKQEVRAAEAPKEPFKLPVWAWIAGVAIVAGVLTLLLIPGKRDVTSIPFQCEQEVVPAGNEIIVYYYWLAKEPEQVDEFFEVAVSYVSVNEVWYKIRRTGLDEMLTDEETGGYKRRYWMNIGSLDEPGWYAINTIVDLESEVYDGWDYFGPGTDTPRLDRTCRVQVVE